MMGASAASVLAILGILLPFPEAIRGQRSEHSPAALRQAAADLNESMLADLDPALLKRAAERGIYNRAECPVLRTVNPFFLSGDFDGDGLTDVAVWVTARSSGLKGVVVIPGDLGAVHFLGAGHGGADFSGDGKSGEVAADAWHILPAGATVRAFTTVPQIGAVDGQPFTVRRETLEFVWLGKSSFAFSWANGQYWEFWTGD